MNRQQVREAVAVLQDAVRHSARDTVRNLDEDLHLHRPVLKGGARFVEDQPRGRVARIEHVVNELAMKRLLDGEFDECGLTLRELRIIEDSLVKSLTAVYHGRVKYPNQQTA